MCVTVQGPLFEYLGTVTEWQTCKFCPNKVIHVIKPRTVAAVLVLIIKQIHEQLLCVLRNSFLCSHLAKSPNVI